MSQTMAYIEYMMYSEMQEVIETLAPVFMYNGIPTEEYKDFLLELVQYVVDADHEARARIQTFLMRCEEGAYLSITGIIPVQKTDHRYHNYETVVNAIYDRTTFMHEDKGDICNSIVVHLIQALEAGCKYSHCYRKNRLHKQLMHHQLQF